MIFFGGNYGDWEISGWKMVLGGDFPVESVKCCSLLGGEQIFVRLLFIDSKVKMTRSTVQFESVFSWIKLFERRSSLGITRTQ